MRKQLLIALIFSSIIFYFYGCIKSFDADPALPDNYTSSFSVPIGAAVIPFDSTVFQDYFPTIPLKKREGIPVKFEDLQFNVDMQDFNMSGLIEFNFSAINEDFSQIELINFKINTENTFPTKIVTQVVFLNDDKETLFSLLEEDGSLFKLPDLADNELVIDPAKQLSEINISNNDLEQLNNARYMFFNLDVNTQRIIEGMLAVDTVTFKRDYYMKIEVGLRVDLNVKIE